MRDHLGSIREMVDASGTPVARYDYDPWGRSITIIGTNKPDFNFTSLYQHAKSGLDMAVRRFYDPDLGRWLNRDPLDDADVSQGPNLYAYVTNDVARRSDPSGLLQLQPDRLIAEDHAKWNWTVLGIPPAGPASVPPISENVAASEAHHLEPSWFYEQVRNGGTWDAKQYGRGNYEFEAFGNFNYGATGSANGFPNIILLRMAGWAQQQAGTSSSDWGDPGWFIDRYPVPFFNGTPPYGDEPDDQFWIQAGMSYFNRCLK